MMSTVGPVPTPAAPGFLTAAHHEAVECVELPAPVDAPQVSVVVATYNHRRYALDLLEALARQEADSFEIVIVDDGSTDGTFPALVARATELRLPGRVIRLLRNRGRSVARNVGVAHARAEIIAFTDADCLPSPGWLVAALAGFSSPSTGMVQGPMQPAPGQPRPFFNHFIEINAFDGTFSTCNMLYRRQAVAAAGGFDPGLHFGEDLDLGWRAVRRGWSSAFAPEAVVYHQVIALPPLKWLLWTRYFFYMPAKVARYPEYRQYLFLGVWVHWFHALFDLALLALPLGLLFHRAYLMLAVPYLLAFPVRHGLRGRWPLVKAALHLAWDSMSFGVLLFSSIRHRRLVL